MNTRLLRIAAVLVGIIILGMGPGCVAHRHRCEATVPHELGYSRDAVEFLVGWARPAPLARMRSGWPDLIMRPRDSAVMALISAGTFMMGRTHDSDRDLNDVPRHEVELTRAFYIDTTEVTARQWRLFAAARPPHDDVDLEGPSDLVPVRDVRYVDAVAYADWAGCSLPTEAQWEYAARAGAPAWRYPWGDEDRIALRNGAELQDGHEDVAPVASYPASAWGLYDMSGNVWEWCRDWFTGAYPATTRAVDPAGPAAPGNRDAHVIRGGGVMSGTSRLRVSHREGRAEAVLFHVGFRLVRPLPLPLRGVRARR